NNFNISEKSSTSMDSEAGKKRNSSVNETTSTSNIYEIKENKKEKNTTLQAEEKKKAVTKPKTIKLSPQQYESKIQCEVFRVTLDLLPKVCCFLMYFTYFGQKNELFYSHEIETLSKQNNEGILLFTKECLDAFLFKRVTSFKSAQIAFQYLMQAFQRCNKAQ